MSNSNRLTPSHSRLQIALQKEALDAGSFAALEIELDKSLDRRKLKRLAKSDRDTRLTFSELHALDTFLRRKGYGGLSRIFSSTGLLESITDLAQTTFLIGFKPESSRSDARTWISHWDLRSVAVLLQGLYRYTSSSRLHVELEEVLLARSPTVNDVQQQSWSSLVENEQPGHSLIAIGSPKASHASEVLLAKMFNVPPFQPLGGSPQRDLPFQFEWTKRQLEETPSSFAYAQELERTIPQGFENFTSFTLRYKGKEFKVPFDKKEWRDYGIVVAQRRANGNLWIVCAGLSGPATFAAARILAREHFEVPTPRQDQTHSDPICRVVEAHVVRGETPMAGDRRKITRESFVPDPAESQRK